MGHSALSDWEALNIRCSEQLVELRIPFNPQPGRAVGIHGQFVCFYTAISDYTCKTKYTEFENCLQISALCDLSLIWIMFVVSSQMACGWCIVQVPQVCPTRCVPQIQQTGSPLMMSLSSSRLRNCLTVRVAANQMALSSTCPVFMSLQAGHPLQAALLSHLL